jgi:hypothetical protein
MLNKIKIPFKVNRREQSGGKVIHHYHQFISDLNSKGFEHIGNGSFREGFARKKIVIKVPRNWDGIIDNITEAFAYSKYRERPTSRNIYLAPCRLLPNLSLMMVKVNFYSDETPFWTKNLIDGQYGLYKKKFVSYDYAFEVVERFDIEKMLKVKSVAWHNEFAYLKRDLSKTVFK